MPVLAVPRERADDFLHELQANRLVDRSRRITKDGGEVFIPVIAPPSFRLEPFGARWCEGENLPRRTMDRDPWDRIREGLQAAGIRPELAPRRWKRIGDVLILRIDSAARRHANAIASIYGRVLGAHTVLEDRSGIHGPLRTPDVRLLWGNQTETVHVEGGVRYSLDLSRIMLSPGNIEERLRIADRIRPGAIVVDLFAGIGYFSLPISVRGRAQTIYACELNPTSFAYLLRNIRLNRAVNVIPLLGDCREVAPRGIADWVVMGHFEAREYLDVAFAVLRGRGTIVYHELCPKEQYPDAMTRRLAAAARANWNDVLAIRTRIVKSYAPGIVHAAAEVEVAPQTRAKEAKPI
ncbi:MAG: class I SAM-dependent methyltransferase [Thermoplasmata archaeon]